MNKQLVIGSVAGALAVTAIAAVGGYRMLDKDNYAEVLAVEPSMKSVSVPRQECRDQLVTVQRPVKDPNQIAGTVAGAVIGGVLGNQVGGGDGKKLATVGVRNSRQAWRMRQAISPLLATSILSNIAVPVSLRAAGGGRSGGRDPNRQYCSWPGVAQ